VLDDAHHGGTTEGLAQPWFLIVVGKRTMSRDVFEVAQEKLEVNSLLLHSEVAKEQSNVFVHQDTRENAKQLQEHHHQSALHPSAPLEQEGQDQEGGVELRDEESVEFVLEDTTRTD
jgi:hypothetical protein